MTETALILIVFTACVVALLWVLRRPCGCKGCGNLPPLKPGERYGIIRAPRKAEPFRIYDDDVLVDADSAPPEAKRPEVKA